MRYEPIGRAFGFDLLGRLPKSQSLRLREDMYKSRGLEIKKVEKPKAPGATPAV